MIKILEKNQRNNVLMNRQELKLLVETHATPSKKEVAKLVSDKIGKEEELVVVKKIISKFGRQTFLITAFVYDNKEDLMKTEKIKGEKKKEEVKQESGNNESKESEAKADDTKEEAKNNEVKEKNDNK